MSTALTCTVFLLASGVKFRHAAIPRNSMNHQRGTNGESLRNGGYRIRKAQCTRRSGGLVVRAAHYSPVVASVAQW